MTGARIGTRKVTHSSLLSGSAMFSVLTALLYPFFEKQIKAGGPVTITSPDIIRYIMAIPEAASLVLQAAMAKGGELFILDMGVSR